MVIKLTKESVSSFDLLEIFPLLGDSKTNLKRGKNSVNKSKAIGNSILDHGSFMMGHLDEDQISNKSYGSHKHRFKDESHKGSADTLDPDEHEEKRDASKEELGIEDGCCFNATFSNR